MTEEATYEAKQISDKLVGATITGAVISDDGDESYFGFQVKLPDGTKREVWVDRDPEGNGPGHLSMDW